jgi:hypothetical protein
VEGASVAAVQNRRMAVARAVDAAAAGSGGGMAGDGGLGFERTETFVRCGRSRFLSRDDLLAGFSGVVCACSHSY